MATAPVFNSHAGPRLTSLSSCGGCGAKLRARDLLPIVADLPGWPDERVLAGLATGDDAGVYRLRDDLTLVQTVDFFTPLVDDPYDFGRIAAANALSDVYAMGGRPLTALNIVAFPLEQAGEAPLREILRGGGDVVAGAGAIVLGGHSIRDSEPKYGMAVTGIVDPAAMTTNAAGREGDVLVLSKPLGTGAIVTAHKSGCASQGLLDRAVDVMTRLNERACDAAVRAGVRAMTDVTGYGLLGHLHLLCLHSGLAAEVEAAAVPAIAGVESLLSAGDGISSGTRHNREWACGFADVAGTVQPWRELLLVDATTSGGLLAAVPVEAANPLAGARIGRLCAGAPGTISVR